MGIRFISHWQTIPIGSKLDGLNQSNELVEEYQKLGLQWGGEKKANSVSYQEPLWNEHDKLLLTY